MKMKATVWLGLWKKSVFNLAGTFEPYKRFQQLQLKAPLDHKREASMRKEKLTIIHKKIKKKITRSQESY